MNKKNQKEIKMRIREGKTEITKTTEHQTKDREEGKDEGINKFREIKTIYLALFVFFILAYLSSFLAAQSPRSCVSHVDCPYGQVCDNGQCRDCLTSAECLSKTFLKSTPLGGVSPWFSISMIVLFIAFSGAVIFYMIAYAFNSDQFKRIAFAELMQVAASFLLIGFLFGFEMFETDLVTKLEQTSGAITSALMLSGSGQIPGGALSGQIQINPFDVSYAFLRNMLSCAQNKLKTTYENSKGIETVINIGIQITVTLPGEKETSLPLPNPMSLLPSLSETAAAYEYLANELTWLIIFLYAQLAVLKFFETSMFTVFLPIGLILRSFPPTRGAGAVLVAIAIGFYFVYPLTFTLLYAGSPKQIEGCNVRVALDTTQLEKTCPVNVGATTQILASSSDLAATLDAAVPQLQAGTSDLRFAAFVYMLISLGVTFIFVRSLSSILGADISEIGRTMLRML
jgi:hypothetical protein